MEIVGRSASERQVFVARYDADAPDELCGSTFGSCFLSSGDAAAQCAWHTPTAQDASFTVVPWNSREGWFVSSQHIRCTSSHVSGPGARAAQFICPTPGCASREWKQVELPEPSLAGSISAGSQELLTRSHRHLLCLRRPERMAPRMRDGPRAAHRV